MFFFRIAFDKNNPRGQVFKKMMSTVFKIKYDLARYPIQQVRDDGKLGCRGCGAEIPKGRQSWCSNKCYKQFEPGAVIAAVRARDKEVCVQCGFDCGTERRKWKSERWKPEIGWTYSDWISRAPPKAEYDHILPFSEGGLTVLENIRTLCSICHKKRTAQWRAAKIRESVG